MSRFQPSSESKLSGAALTSLLPGDPLPDKPAIRMSHSAGGRPDEPLITDHVPVDGIDSMDDARMLGIARQCYQSSEDYFNASHRNRVMDAMARFRSEHPRGSKYSTDAFKRRSKLVRPKTRAMVRKREAAAIAAMFSTTDVVSITATNNGDAQAARDARIQDELLNIRLTGDDRWYKLVVGSVQDADRQGIMIGTSEWEYRESTKYYDHHDMVTGERTKHKVTSPSTDRPGWRLIPGENFRFSPSANWLDIVNSSPYLIELRPTYVCDIRDYMNNPRARLKYRNLSDAELLMGTRSAAWDPIRVAREGNKLDRYDRNGQINDFSTVWVHRNIIRIQGEDYVYDTVGTNVMLSNVVPLSALDPRGYRPYVVGTAMIESHNPFPDGAVTLMAPLQDAIDVNSNLRIDANQMSTSGRMFVKRASGIDLNALARFSPGAAVEMDDVNSVRWDRPPPPPSSNFEENNLLNTEMDDLIGNFNQSSVAANKQLNETVGGMEMLGAVGSQMTEYDLHTAGKTFFEPLLRQILDLIKLYETDRVMAAMVGSKFAVSETQYWAALQTPTSLALDVGYGATNPMQRLSKLNTGLETMGKYFPYLMMMADQSEITSEIFGACGYPDATRFFPFLDQKDMEDPKYKTLIMQLNQMRMMAFPHIAEAQGRQQQGQAQAQGAIQSATIRSQSAERVAAAANAAQIQLLQMKLEMAKVELQLEQEKNDMARDQLMMQREKLSSDIAIAQETMALEAQGTAIAPDHTQEQPLDPQTQGLVNRLQSPGSGPLPTMNTQQAFQQANSEKLGGEPPPMTGAQLRQHMTSNVPDQPSGPSTIGMPKPDAAPGQDGIV